MVGEAGVEPATSCSQSRRASTAPLPDHVTQTMPLPSIVKVPPLATFEISHKMRIIADLHLHSRFALATSPRLNVKTLAQAARTKGVDLIAAPDFTHPIWRRELRDSLTETAPGSGIYTAHGANFMLVTEVACVWRQDGVVRRVHLLLTAPDFSTAERISKSFAADQNLESDGRPTLKLSARDVLNIVRDADLRCQVIPAHAFTPWYGILGAKTGFNSLEEAFGDDADQIIAIESGLSADPGMMSAIPDCANRAIVSFSDAHSADNVAREATVFEVRDLTYDSVIDALKRRRITETLEFNPAHGKYHLDGHRRCGIRFAPEESRTHDNTCPVCAKPLTLGVLHRTAELSSVKHTHDPADTAQPYRHIVPLREIISHVYQCRPNSKSASGIYDSLIESCGPELQILAYTRIGKLNRHLKQHVRRRGYAFFGIVIGNEFTQAIKAVRNGEVDIEPGYDGVYGHARIRSKPGMSFRSGYGLAT